MESAPSGVRYGRLQNLYSLSLTSAPEVRTDADKKVGSSKLPAGTYDEHGVFTSFEGDPALLSEGYRSYLEQHFAADEFEELGRRSVLHSPEGVVDGYDRELLLYIGFRSVVEGTPDRQHI